MDRHLYCFRHDILLEKVQINEMTEEYYCPECQQEVTEWKREAPND